jgi:DNA-binding transcriptional regulator YhcF (GntR family)
MKVASLSAKDIQEALEERILQGLYPPGAPLPTVRQLADEMGSSPSTVGRALQMLQQKGWVQVADRRGAAVAPQLPGDGASDQDIEGALRKLAVRWRLSGQEREAFDALAQRVGDEVFQPEPKVVFVECNRRDLAHMTEQIQWLTSLKLTPLLIDELPKRSLDSTIVLTPFFHLAEVREVAPPGVEIVPLNFVPEEDALLELADLSSDATVGVIGAHERSRRRLEGVVQQFSLAHIASTTIANRERVEQLVASCEVIVTTNAAQVPKDVLARAKRVITIRFSLEPRSLALSRVAQWREGRSPAVTTLENDSTGDRRLPQR